MLGVFPLDYYNQEWYKPERKKEEIMEESNCDSRCDTVIELLQELLQNKKTRLKKLSQEKNNNNVKTHHTPTWERESWNSNNKKYT